MKKNNKITPLSGILWNSVYDSVSNSVYDSVSNSVSNSVWRSYQ